MIKIKNWGASEWRAVAGVLACLLIGWAIGTALAEWRASVHAQAYAQGWSDGASDGTAQGWRGCIEENNLYYRY